MKHTSYNLEINKRATKNTTYPIYVRISQDGKHRKIKTPIAVSKLSDFDSKRKRGQWIKPSEPNYKKWNTVLLHELEQVEQAGMDLRIAGKIATANNVMDKVNSQNSNLSFISFAELYAERIEKEGKYNTYKKYITFINKLKDFTQHKDLLFSEIDLKFLNDFKSYLYQVPNKRTPNLKLHPNTISKQFDQFASLLNKGITENKLENYTDPFEGFECKTIPTNKNKLSIEDIKKIINLNLEKGTLIWHCRNYFMFSFYCAGMRASDLIQLRGTNIQNNRLVYSMQKTNKGHSVALPPEALKILSYYMDIKNPTHSYIFPLLKNDSPYAIADTVEAIEKLPSKLKTLLLQHVNSKNSLINKGLKKIAILAGFTQKLTMHIARHSFANIARQLGAGIFDVSKSLGHGSLKTTEVYFSTMDNETTDGAILKVSEAVNHTEGFSHKYLQSLSKEQKKELIDILLNELK